MYDEVELPPVADDPLWRVDPVAPVVEKFLVPYALLPEVAPLPVNPDDDDDPDKPVAPPAVDPPCPYCLEYPDDDELYEAPPVADEPDCP